MQEELSKIWESLSRIKNLIKKLQKYRSQSFYKKQYDSEILELNRNYKFLKARIKDPSSSLEEKLEKLNGAMQIVLSSKQYKIKLKTIKQLEMFWPELEIELSEINSEVESFRIPKEIPMNEQRLDLEEAMRDFNGKCYLSSLVLCRRAYEGALATAYKLKMKTEPVEDELCPKCNKKIRSKYIGITKLHRWALKENIVNEKLESVGYLTADLGAGGAHPPLHRFPRDPELAKLGIQTTIALLKEIYSQIKP